MRSIVNFLLLAGAISGGIALKNYVRRFAGWNLFVLIVAAFVVETLSWIVIASVYQSMSK